MFSLACFSTDQVYAWKPDFDRNNITRWTKNGLLIRLRQGYFTFREYKDKADYAWYFANRIYRPSYISLHSALSFHGLIPESVVQITSVTSLKTASFKNPFGEYSYKTLKKELMFGYSLITIEDGRSMQIADPVRPSARMAVPNQSSITGKYGRSTIIENWVLSVNLILM